MKKPVNRWFTMFAFGLIFVITACQSDTEKAMIAYMTQNATGPGGSQSTQQALQATSQSLAATQTALSPETVVLAPTATLVGMTPTPTQAVQVTPTATDFSLAIQTSFLNQIGGVSYTLEVLGNRAYLGVGPRLYILDITNPAKPTKISQSDDLGAAVIEIVIDGKRAYISTMINLSVIDLTNESQPRLVFTENLLFKGIPYYWITRHEQTLYGFFSLGLVMIDISQPEQPKLAGSYPTDWEIREAVVINRANTPYLVIAGAGAHFQVLDIRQPLKPVLVGETVIDFPPDGIEPHPTLNEISVVGDMAYVSSWNSGFLIVDLSDLSSPRQRGIYTVKPQEVGVVSDGQYAYLADDLIGLRVMDVANPDQPVEVGSVMYDLAGKAVAGLGDHRGMALQDGKVYVASLNQGMAVFDGGDPKKPKLLGSYTAPAPGEISYLQLRNNWIFAIGDQVGLRIIDISDLANPVETGFVDSGNNLGWRTPQDLAVYKNFIYIADINHGFFVNEVSDQGVPRQATAYYTYDWKPRKRVIGDVEIVGSTLYLPICNAIGSSGASGAASGGTAPGKKSNSGCQLSIMDLADPVKPRIVEEMELPWHVNALAANSQKLYLVGLSNMLIMDISNPFKPVKISESTLPQEQIANRVRVNGNLLFIGYPAFTMLVMDISDPSNPTEIKMENPMMLMTVSGFDILDNRLYTKLGYILDITNPPGLPLLGMAPIWNCWDVAARSDLVVYSCLDQGIRLFGLSK